MNHNEQSASKRLALGAVIYMIGNISSRVLQMLILPIITGALQTSEYGYYDLIVTTINLVMPIITLQIIEGMFRYMFSADEKDKSITLSSVTSFLVLGMIVLAASIIILRKITTFIQYPILIYLNYCSAIVFNFCQKIARCEQRNKLFAVSGVINTIIMLSFQAITLVSLRMGVEGMLISNCVSYFGAALFIVLKLRIWKWIRIEYIEINTIKKLLVFSMPLVPNSVCWWLVDSSDRYVITYALGTASTGVYSIAGKFSQLLTVMTSVFQLAWQENAIIEADSKERDSFYTRTFNTYMKLLLGGYLIVLPFIKIIVPFLLAESYQIGFMYNPLLLIGAIFSAFSQFYGSAYLVFEKTNGAIITTIVAAIINVSVGFSLIRYMGLFAPALGTVIAFFVQWLIRAYQMKSYFKVKIDYVALLKLLSAICVVTIIYYLDYLVLQFASLAFGLTVFIIMNRKLIGVLLSKIVKIKRNR